MRFGGKMLMRKEDLELRLSSSACGGDRRWMELNLMPASYSSSSSSFFSEKKNTWMNVSGSSDVQENVAERSLEVYRGIDVNKIPSTTADAEEEAAISSPNSTVSSTSGKRSERDQNGEENEIEKASSRGISDEEDGDGSRKKLRLSKEQSVILEESFKEHNTLTPKQKLSLAKQLNLRPRQVEVWFQNRRARTKLKQTEVDCEFLKRRWQRLTEENRRLYKEIQELKTLKFSPQFYMQMNPPTTLTMCSSCELVAVASPDSDQNHHLPVNSIFPSISNHRRSSVTTPLSACLQAPIRTLNVLPPGS